MLWTNKEIKLLKMHYANNRLSSTKDLAKKLNRNVYAVYMKAQALGLKPKYKSNTKYTINENFFSKPNLLNSYWAGFIAADGGISAKSSKKVTRLIIKLQRRDKKLLYKFKKDINFTGPIKDREYYLSYDRTRISAVSVLEINSEKICADLKKNFNIIPNKSLVLKPPKQLTEKQILAYIVGYIDGDGCVSLIDNALRLNILGTKTTLFFIHKLLTKKLNLIHKSLPIVKRKNIYSYTIYGHNAKTTILFLKNNFKSILNRKWNKVYKYTG